MIKCNFIKIPEYTTISNKDEKKFKCGRYHNSKFWDVEGFGDHKWIIAVYINISIIPKDIKEQKLIEECVEYLNSIMIQPRRKKGRKRKPKPIKRYGNLELYSYKYIKSKKCYSLLLITDQKDNNYFWGKGINYDSTLKCYRIKPKRSK